MRRLIKETRRQALQYNHVLKMSRQIAELETISTVVYMTSVCHWFTMTVTQYNVYRVSFASSVEHISKILVRVFEFNSIDDDSAEPKTFVIKFF